MHAFTDTEVELSFMETKTEIKSFLISLFSVQFIFHLLASIYIQIISYFQFTLNLGFLSPRSLSSFALDTWLIVLFLIFFFIGYSMLKKAKDFPLYLLTVYPAVLVLLSLLRDVSLFQIFVFSLLSCVVVLQVSYQRVKQLEYSQA